MKLAPLLTTRLTNFLLQIVTMIIGFLFLLPAAIFTALEPKWGYSDALYYCFISLTTIGLGDFIPGDNTGQHLRPLYKACTTSKTHTKLFWESYEDL